MTGRSSLSFASVSMSEAMQAHLDATRTRELAVMEASWERRLAEAVEQTRTASCGVHDEEMESVLVIDDSEITSGPSGTGRIHLYAGNGPSAFTSGYAGGSGTIPTASNFWSRSPSRAESDRASRVGAMLMPIVRSIRNTTGKSTSINTACGAV